MVKPNSPPPIIAPESADGPWIHLVSQDTSSLAGGTWTASGIFLFVVIGLTLMPGHVWQPMLQNLLGQQSLTKIANVFLVCSIFMVVGPLLMVLNKIILTTLSFDLPLTLCCLGVLTTAAVIRSFVAIGVCKVRQEALDTVAGNGWYRAVLPIALCKATTLATGNAVYLHLGLGFIQMLKAVTPVIVCVTMFAFRLPLPTQMARWGVGLIISGTLLEVKGEAHATMIGLVLMFTSEIAEAVNLVLSQKLLHNCKLTLVETLYMVSPPSGLFLFCAAAVVEGPTFLYEGRYRVMIDYPWHFVMCCILGLAVNFSGMAVVQATSSLTCKLLNTIRGIAVILFGIVFYSEPCSTLEIFGYAVALLGFTLYNVAQYNADQKNSAASQQLLPEHNERKCIA